MRAAGERYLARFADFQSVDGRAEGTTLPDASVDLVAAGQAFHWFNLQRSRVEFRRILKPPRWALLVWNIRKQEGNPFMRAYEDLIRNFGTDYARVSHHGVDDESLHEFYGTADYRLKSFDNWQTFDLNGLSGRLLSASYAPRAGHPNYSPMLSRLKDIYASYQRKGLVKFEYQTRVFVGRLT